MSQNEEIAAVVARLELQFPDVPADEVASITHAVHVELSERPIRHHLPVLVEHDARERLRELTRPD